MKTSRGSIRICILALYLTAATISFTQCAATNYPSTHHRSLFLRTAKKLNIVKRIEYFPFDSSKQQNQEPYGLNLPLSLPPYDSLAPVSLPDSSSNPFCTDPPRTPSTTTPTPASPQSPYLYIPPILPMQSPPPGPIVSIPGPPYYEPSPPGFSIPSPPSFVPSPPCRFQPSPPVFEPPVVFPPPTTPRSPKRGPAMALWCVAKPTVPDPIIQEAMNYACGSGADCASIQPNGPCFQPDTSLAHASFAFNSYWQRTKVAGGTCEFGGTAMLVTLDPSFDGCQFDYA